MNHALAVGWLGEALLLAGRVGEAVEQADRSLDLARERGERGAEAWALRLQAEIAAHQDVRADGDAERLYREALVLAEELEMRPLQAHCRLGLGRLLGRAGRRDEALRALEAAATMLGELGMARWLAEADAERARLRG